jgi:putative metalloprotease
MKLRIAPLWLLLTLTLSGCAAESMFAVGAGVLQATTLDENSVRQTSALAAREMDNKNQVAPANSPYSQRLGNLTRNLSNYDGMNLNFKVYLTKDINAFAMADGTVRVYSGLMDVMPDDQVLAVIAHEVGHVKLKHSYNQMRAQILTDSAFQGLVSAGGVIGNLSSSLLGKLGQTAINAHFSQQDELEADAYAVKALKRWGKDPYAMRRSIETLEGIQSAKGGFLSSHPSNKARLENIDTEIKRL